VVQREGVITMQREIERWRALANAIFVLVVLGLAVFGTTQVANRHWQWRATFHARARFASIGGLEVGSKVRVQGVSAGVVESIESPEKPGGPVTLVLRIDDHMRPLVRSDAMARIVPQGVVGAKVVEIVPGQPDAPALAERGVLKTEPPLELADLLQDASGALRKLDEVTAAARQGLGEVNAIAAGIREGKGSVGRLFQDDEAYRKLMALSSRGEHTLNDLEENLAALKRTWPLSRYFNDRAFYDRDRVLFQPGAERESRVLKEEELFEPGRSVLTAQGRRKLDEIAKWIGKIKRPKSEVVIAAFTDDPRGDDLAQVLTQEQADAARKYLVSEHAIDSIGWFGSRKVAAVGFGTQTPRYKAEESDSLPARRVEVILFTPQT
jgi:phospholipid/cholesterol/gamma-HCH transport system substrate-binding protein